MSIEDLSETVVWQIQFHKLWQILLKVAVSEFIMSKNLFLTRLGPPPPQKKKNVDIVRLIKPGMGLWIQLYISYVSYKHFNNMWHTTLILLLYELTVMSGTSDGGVMNARWDGCQQETTFQVQETTKHCLFILCRDLFHVSSIKTFWGVVFCGDRTN